MKQKDIAVVAVVVLFSAIVSFSISHVLFDGPKNRSVKAEVVEAINADNFVTPDKKYFNESSVDPTQQVIIGNGSNNAPFTSAQ